MIALFLDANFFISVAEQRREIDLTKFVGNRPYISSLSIHILTYLYKYEMPNSELLNLLKESYNIVDLNSEIVIKSLNGPTEDFEDNVQLHSAATADCDFFLTEDKKLLALKFFGKSRITDSL